MEISIKEDEKNKLVITNDFLDSENFVSVYFIDTENDEEKEIIVSMEELYSAIGAFLEEAKLKRERFKE